MPRRPNYRPTVPAAELAEKLAIIQTKKLLTTEEAGLYLDLVPVTLDRWRPKGRGPRYVKIGSNVRYPREELDKFLKENMVETGN